MVKKKEPKTMEMEIETTTDEKTVASSFKVERNSLKKAIQKAIKTVGNNRSESPILASLYLTIENDELTIYSTDMKNACSVTIPVNGEIDGKVLLPGKVFNDIINAIPKTEDDIIEVSWDASGKTSITAPGYQYEITAIQAEYQQYIMSINNGVQFTISRAMLAHMISMVMPAVGDDEYRPDLMVARLELDGDQIKMVATDSRRLVMVGRSIEDMDVPKTNLHILGKGLKDLIGIIDSDIVTVTIDQSGKLASFVSENRVFYIRLMDANYPEYSGIVPVESKIVVDVEGKKFLEAIEGIMPMAKNMNHIIRMEITEKKIRIISDGDEQGKATIDFDTLSNNGGNLQIAFNARYIYEALKNISHLTLRLSFNKNLTPMLIRQVDSDVNFTWVVMPIRQ